MTHTCLMNFLISLKVLQASQASIPYMVYFITQQSSFIVPAISSLVYEVFISGTLEFFYWQIRAQLVSGPMGPMGG